MKPRRIVLPAGALLAALAAPAPAQSCGPLTFLFTTTGAGCGPTGTGPIPALSGLLTPFPGLPGCPVRIQVNTIALLFPIPTVTLVLGLSNPALPIPSLPGCTLWTSPDLFLGMMMDAGGPTVHALTFFLPPDPALIGATGYGQAAVPVPGGFRISNGVQISIG